MNRLGFGLLALAFSASAALAEAPPADVKVGEWMIRPPQNFTLTQKSTGDKQTLIFIDSTAKGSSKPTMVVVTRANPMPLKNVSEDLRKNFNKMFIVGFTTPLGLKALQKSEPEPVKLGGLPFYRSHWSGKRVDNTILYGFAYSYVDKLKALHVTGMSSDRGKYQVMEGSAMTVHK